LDIILQAILLLIMGACQRGKAGGLPVSGTREASTIRLCPAFSRLKGDCFFIKINSLDIHPIC